MPDEPSITQHAQGSYIAQAASGGSATVNVVLPPPAVQERNRVRFLKRLRYRYDEQWEQSLEGAGLLTLRLVSKPEAVLHHTGTLFLPPQQSERPLPLGTSIAQVYEQAGQELLILGESGMGKSTLLLDLARRLVERAQQDASEPLPVIIPLSSWAVKQQPLTDWLSDQLTQLYDVPRRLSYFWVQTDQLLLLLDGLDEVPQEARIACFEAINAYRKEHLVPLALCSRRLEYEEIPRQQRLVMQSAVVIQPLTQEQVEAYLLEGGEALTPVRTVLRINPVLQELLTTPLMLHILTLTYAGSKAHDLAERGAVEEQQRIIFARYIARMIERRSNRLSFPLQRIIPWLSWLAQQMQQQSQTVFYLEQMQPDWLSGDRMPRGYDWLAVRLPSILMGMLASLAINTFLWGVPDPPTLIYEILLGGLLGGLLSARSAIQRPVTNSSKGRSIRYLPFWHWLLLSLLIGLGIGVSYWQGNAKAVLIYGLIYGLCTLLLQVLLAKGSIAESSSQTSSPTWGIKWQHLMRSTGLRNGLLVGLLVGLSQLLSIVLSYGSHDLLHDGPKLLFLNLSLGVQDALSFGLLGSLLSVLLIGRSSAVQPTDRLIWSRRSLGRSLFSKGHVSATLWVTALIGLLVGLSTGLYYGQESGLSFDLWEGLSNMLSFGLISGLSYWLLLGLFRGVSSETLEDQQRVAPNQGIRRSAFNGLVSVLISTVLVGLSSILSRVLFWGLLVLITRGPQVGLSQELRAELSVGLNHGLSEGLSIVWIIGLSFGLLVGLLNGGLASLRHYILRFLLWRTGVMPWPYIRFLNEATDCILLRRVGGGYSFVHRLILDYFVSLDNPLTKPETTQTIPSQAVPSRVCSACGYQEERPGTRFCAGCGKSLVL